MKRTATRSRTASIGAGLEDHARDQLAALTQILESELGKGSTFTLEVPLRRPAAHPVNA